MCSVLTAWSRPCTRFWIASFATIFLEKPILAERVSASRQRINHIPSVKCRYILQIRSHSLRAFDWQRWPCKHVHRTCVIHRTCVSYIEIYVLSARAGYVPENIVKNQRCLAGWLAARPLVQQLLQQPHNERCMINDVVYSSPSRESSLNHFATHNIYDRLQVRFVCHSWWYCETILDVGQITSRMSLPSCDLIVCATAKISASFLLLFPLSSCILSPLMPIMTFRI